MQIVNPDELKIGDIVKFYSQEGHWHPNVQFKIGHLYKVYSIDSIIVDVGHIAYGQSKTNNSPMLEDIITKESIETAWWGTFEWVEKVKPKVYGIVKFLEGIKKI